MILLNDLKSFLEKNEDNGTSYLELVKKFNVPVKSNKDFSSFLFELVKKNIIDRDRNNNYYFLKLIGNVETKIIITSKGFGLVEYKNEKFFISKHDLKYSLNGDIVSANIYSYGRYSKAIVNKVIKRNRDKLIGLIFSEKNEIHFKILNDNLNNKINVINYSVEYLDHFVEVKIKDIFVDSISVEIIKDLGDKNIPYSDINLFINASNVSSIFDKHVEDEAKEIPATVEKLDEGRIDLRSKLIVTIDGEKTKDFDDAIFVEENDDFFTIGIYIADVAYYVKDGSYIDLEAKKRGTSIYLIDKVIPMLPEILSNGICSLNPNVDRNVLALEVKMNKLGQIISSKTFPALINSKFRLTYNEVNNYDHNWIAHEKELSMMLKKAFDASNIILKNKLKNGYIDFEIQEPQISLDENGKTNKISIRERGESEKMIENFMVLANEVIAKKIFDKKLPSLYRVHEYPSEEKINELQKIINFLKIPIQLPRIENKKSFYDAISEFKKYRFDDLVKISLLRTMQKAKYSSNNIGHFGLASEYYSHFTSPIRRYPDLIIHRIIRELLFKNNHLYLESLKKSIENIANLTSEAEEQATNLERKITGMKLAQFYENKINQSFYSTIVSIKRFGFFVEFEDKVSALVAIENLIDGPYEINKDETILFNKNNKKYNLGQKVKVRIINVDYLRQRIDAIVEK
ncbi:MAG: ribonuclease R [Metamycoplasmataceae bacterium]